MSENKSKMIKYAMIAMGALGYVVMILPWFNLSSSASVGGYSSSMDAGNMLGFSAAFTTFFGYLLYLLPAGAVALAIKVSDETLPPRAKGFVMELIGAVGIICLLFLMKEMKTYDTSISGSGYYGSAGYSPIIGFWVAEVVYGLYVVVGLVIMAISPKIPPQNEQQ